MTCPICNQGKHVYPLWNGKFVCRDCDHEFDRDDRDQEEHE